jgi:hypothetical protein
VDLGGHLTRPVDCGLPAADFRFEIERKERVKDVVSKEGEQQETLDGIGLVPVDVIRGCKKVCVNVFRI